MRWCWNWSRDRRWRRGSKRTGAEGHPARRSAGDRAADRGRARCGARARHRPPRSEAGEHRALADGVVKVLDFGLAKRPGAGSGEAGRTLTNSPTMMAPTVEGVLLGTAPYMSPEQARGKAVDKRTDIWAFGCVLYEMLTGRRAFDGETSSDVIAAILEREPDFSLPATPRRRRTSSACWRARSTRIRRRDCATSATHAQSSTRVGPRLPTRRRPRVTSRRSRASRLGRARRWPRRPPPRSPSRRCGCRRAPLKSCSTCRFRRASRRLRAARDLTRRPIPRGRSHLRGTRADLAASDRLDGRPDAARHRRRDLSVLVAGRQVDRLFRRTEAEADRARRRSGLDRRRRAGRARRHVAAGRHDPVRAQRRSARCSACRRLEERPSPRRSSSPARTITGRRFSCPTAVTFCTTRAARRRSAASTSRGSTDPNRGGSPTPMPPRSTRVGPPAVRPSGRIARAAVRRRSPHPRRRRRPRGRTGRRQSGDQPGLAGGVAVRRDRVRGQRRPKRAVRLGRSDGQEDRSARAAGADADGDAVAVAGRTADRLQPRRRQQLGHLADGHARDDEPADVGSRARLQPGLVGRRPADIL